MCGIATVQATKAPISAQMIFRFSTISIRITGHGHSVSPASISGWGARKRAAKRANQAKRAERAGQRKNKQTRDGNGLLHRFLCSPIISFSNRSKLRSQMLTMSQMFPGRRGEQT